MKRMHLKGIRPIGLGLTALLCAGLAGTVQADDQNRPSSTASSSQHALRSQAAPPDQVSVPPPNARTGEMKGKEETATAQRPTKFNKASQLIGMEVKNESGDKLGDIKDIVLDLNQGQVSYVVLGTGGFLGLREKLLAVPLTAFTRSADQSHLVLRADKQSISRAEGIGNNWPSIENPSFAAMPFWQKPDQSTTSPETKPARVHEQ